MSFRVVLILGVVLVAWYLLAANKQPSIDGSQKSQPGGEDNSSVRPDSTRRTRCSSAPPALINEAAEMLRKSRRSPPNARAVSCTTTATSARAKTTLRRSSRSSENQDPSRSRIASIKEDGTPIVQRQPSRAPSRLPQSPRIRKRRTSFRGRNSLSPEVAEQVERESSVELQFPGAFPTSPRKLPFPTPPKSNGSPSPELDNETPTPRSRNDLPRTPNMTPVPQPDWNRTAGRRPSTPIDIDDSNSKPTRAIRKAGSRENPIAISDEVEPQKPDRDLNPDDKKPIPKEEEKKAELLASYGLVLREFGDDNLAGDDDVKEIIHRWWGKLCRPLRPAHLSKTLEDITKVLHEYRTAKTKMRMLARKSKKKVKKAANGTAKATEKILDKVGSCTKQNKRTDTRTEIPDSQESDGTFADDDMEPVLSRIVRLELNLPVEDSDIEIEDYENKGENAEHHQTERFDGDHEFWVEDHWQSLFFCSTHGILNTIIRQSKRRRSSGNKSEILAFIEEKRVLTNHFPFPDNSKKLRPGNYYLPDGMYGYHTDVFANLPPEDIADYIFRPAAKKELCLPFLCCELKTQSAAKKLEAENQIKERMMHICHIYHLLEEAAGLSELSKKMPAFGFSALGSAMSFWVMMRYEDADKTVKYDLRRTWEGNIFDSEHDQAEFVKIIHNIRAHAYGERKNHIENCLKRINNGSQHGSVDAISILASQDSFKFSVEDEVIEDELLQVEGQGRAKSTLNCLVCNRRR